MLALVDATYNFIYVDVGCQGRISDGGVFNNTAFKEQLDGNSLHLPPPHPLTEGAEEMPYVFVGDEAFQLSAHLMKPYSGLHEKGSKQRVFNYRLSRARRVSENAFGILASSFRVLRRPMLLEPNVATKVTLAIIHLHNYLRKSPSKNVYCPPGIFDKECHDSGEVIPGIWRRDTASSQLANLPNIPRRASIEAQNVRHKFADYFSSTQGELHFQYNM